MNKNELKNIYGGVSFSAAFISSVVRAITSLYDIGRRVGSYIIRYRNGKTCGF